MPVDSSGGERLVNRERFGLVKTYAFPRTSDRRIPTHQARTRMGLHTIASDHPTLTEFGNFSDSFSD